MTQGPERGCPPVPPSDMSEAIAAAPSSCASPAPTPEEMARQTAYEPALARGDNQAEFHTGADQWPPEAALVEARNATGQALAATIFAGDLDLATWEFIIKKGSHRPIVEVGLPPDFIARVARVDAAIIEISTRVLGKAGYHVEPREASPQEEAEDGK